MSKPASNYLILGGGVAGVSLAFLLDQQGLSYELVEKESTLGGCARTFSHGAYLFDAGSHRFHDQYKEVTDFVLELLGDDAEKKCLPSYIFIDHKLVNFPLSVLGLIKSLSFSEFLIAGCQVVANRLFSKPKGDSFEDLAHYSYGTIVSDKFLANYSQKLWGLPVSELSSKLFSKRLRGLDLKSLLFELVGNRKLVEKSLDGEFYYCKQGIGQIIDELTKDLDKNALLTDSTIEHFEFDDTKLKSITIDGKTIDTSDKSVLCTLPLPILANRSNLGLRAKIQFRHTMLVGIVVAQKSVTNAVCYYFPEKSLVFTRLYEPKVCSTAMAPEDSTLLILEVPFSTCDDFEELKELAVSQLLEQHLFESNAVKESFFVNVFNSYPILKKDSESEIKELLSIFDGFSNLTLLGRSAKFRYLSIHDILEETIKWSSKHSSKA